MTHDQRLLAATQIVSNVIHILTSKVDKAVICPATKLSGEITYQKKTVQYNNLSTQNFKLGK